MPIDHFKALFGDGERAQFEEEWSRHPLVAYDHALVARELDATTEAYAGRDLLGGTPDRYSGDAYARLTELKMPSLYFVGQHDTKWLKAVAAEFGRLVPDSRVETIADAGHFSNMTQPDAFNALMRGFLK